MATSIHIAIETFKEVDEKLLEFVIHNYKPKLTKNLFMDFNSITHSDKPLLAETIQVKHKSLFSGVGWTCFVNLKPKTSNNYVNYIKFYFMGDIFMHFPTVLCNKSSDVEYLAVQD